MLRNRFFVVGAGIALVLLIIFLGSLVKFIFDPIVSLVSLLVVPLLIAAFFYYPLRPVIRYLERHRWNRNVSVMTIFLVGLLILVGCSLWVWPPLSEQVNTLIDNAPNITQSIIDQIQQLQNTPAFARFVPDNNEEMLSRLTGYLNTAITWVSENISSMFSFISSFMLVLATAPILLYFLLRDDNRVTPQLMKIFPERFKEDGRVMLDDIDTSLSNFIAGRVIVNFGLCIILYIGFLIIGLPYSLLLVIIAFFLNFIPFIGAFVAAVPVGIIGLIESPSMALWSIVIVIIAQLIQNNVLEPLVFGKQLDMHPFTVIVVVLVGGDIMGILGMLICIPVYMTLKIIIQHVYQMYVKNKIKQTLN
ncbi:AI-2E family transporter [Saccharibacillus kuerlensis]|uniref:AI-2E family transporter n=1 Tax=Saccharibacillus kuerlensis TaxID=459527 RepID=A0ABQ2LA03_9BACL|nr:AI-2E family transporter [Saccharibacillus kuerlensis]GGO08079.1 AI-2E family transporter [Saccharibacillus kuerlensis]